MSDRIHVLLADDEEIIRDNLGPLLERNGFVVTTVSNGQAALDQIPTVVPDVIVLDVMMPHMNGREVLREIREAQNWTPVILLTNVGDADERAMALEEGADDYLNKPFNTHELIARIKNVLRRVQQNQPSLATATRLNSGQLSFDRISHRVYVDGKEVSLTAKAINLLEYMMTHPDELIGRDRLLDVVWGWDYVVGTRAVDTRVAELRRLLGDDANHPRYIETIPGQGYRFVGEVKQG
ncbi:MAG: response regulator transcription factor [Anaerolineae bacterium]|nr:response regulator transcription factor [Anaerolineae bacterium]MCB9458701.1 response regulator transcription factor [Anaerolineaceae bacterium]